MSTTMPKASEINRKWYIIDAKGKPLGKVAVVAADILRGKIKTDYAPNVDCGDHVIVINCAEAVLTGKKLEQKYYRWHTGWIGGLKEIKYKDLMKQDPGKAVTLAVKGMLPHNSLGAKAATRLRVFAGDQHTHAAQKPEVYEF